MFYRHHLKPYIPLMQVLTVSAIVTVFYLKNQFSVNFPINFQITQQFLSEIAPGALLICLLLGFGHYFINQRLNYSVKTSKLSLCQKVFGLSFFLGCSNLLLFLKAEKLKLTQRDRYMILLIGLSSAGGISCVSMSALGIPVYQLLLASLVMPLAIIILNVPFKREKSGSSVNYAVGSIQQSKTRKKLSDYLSQYLVGGCKLTANKTITIMFFEVLKGSVYKSDIDWSYVTHYPHLLLKDLGFSAQAAEVITQAWIAKTVANREAALIDVANAGIYDELTLIQQMLTLSLLINIASVSAFIVVGLNIMALFGKQANQYLKILPIAFFIVNIVPILPVGVYSLLYW
ncbi:hypothetical protein JYB87_12045 [Shewanella avicenniae]|uniref:Uncharacterized protein n=1 Tax=Shewanella avicenniae TaxID=2814294 RepID=A0ABX7QN99_9GAMM|nr:hypothetical protein [Shewanella avicenniae]QSX32497.1 hypothetical protein JYB87_12045 [Shewanella avicenniae]